MYNDEFKAKINIMPNPEQVRPHNFVVNKILYNDDSFSIAWGQWEDGSMRTAMRWNGNEGEGDAGYPKTFGNPMWFQLPKNLTVPLLKGLLGLKDTVVESLIEVIKKQ